MMLKDSFSEPDWLSETHSLSEAASSLNKCKTLEDVEPESSGLSAQPTHSARTLSLLVLSMFRPA